MNFRRIGDDLLILSFKHKQLRNTNQKLKSRLKFNVKKPFSFSNWNYNISEKAL